MTDFYNSIDNHSIRKALISSIIIHFIIVLLIYFGSILTPKPRYLLGDVYTVNLTGMPMASGTLQPSQGAVPLSLPEAPTSSKGKSDAVSPKIDKVTPKTFNTKTDDAFPLKIKTPQPSQTKPLIRSIFNQGNDTEKPNPSTKAGPEIKKFSGGTMLGAVKGNNHSTNASTGTPGSNMGSSMGGMQGKPFPDPYYLQKIQERITQNWSPPEGIIGRNKQMNLLVYFSINRQGKISSVMIEEPSGSTVLDQSAIRAVQLSDPLLPIPAVIKEDILKVHFKFTYNS